MAKYKQASMFAGGEDLPLFSGAAVRVADAGPVATGAEEKQLTWAACQTCQDTGTVKVGGRSVACTCDAGRAVAAARAAADAAWIDAYRARDAADAAAARAAAGAGAGDAGAAWMDTHLVGDAGARAAVAGWMRAL